MDFRDISLWIWTVLMAFFGFLVLLVEQMRLSCMLSLLRLSLRSLLLPYNFRRNLSVLAFLVLALLQLLLLFNLLAALQRFFPHLIQAVHLMWRGRFGTGWSEFDDRAKHTDRIGREIVTRQAHLIAHVDFYRGNFCFRHVLNVVDRDTLIDNPVIDRDIIRHIRRLIDDGDISRGWDDDGLEVGARKALSSQKTQAGWEIPTLKSNPPSWRPTLASKWT